MRELVETELEALQSELGASAIDIHQALALLEKRGLV